MALNVQKQPLEGPPLRRKFADFSLVLVLLVTSPVASPALAAGAPPVLLAASDTRTAAPPSIAADGTPLLIEAKPATPTRKIPVLFLGILSLFLILLVRLLIARRQLRTAAQLYMDLFPQAQPDRDVSAHSAFSFPIPDPAHPRGGAPEPFLKTKDNPLSAYDTPPEGARTAYETPPVPEPLPDNVTPFPRLLPAPDQQPPGNPNTFDVRNI